MSRAPRMYASPGNAKRYHSTPACEGLNSTATWHNIDGQPIIRATAIRRGLTPCKICKPAPLLTVVP